MLEILDYRLRVSEMVFQFAEKPGDACVFQRIWSLREVVAWEGDQKSVSYGFWGWWSDFGDVGLAESLSRVRNGRRSLESSGLLPEELKFWLMLGNLRSGRLIWVVEFEMSCSYSCWFGFHWDIGYLCNSTKVWLLSAFMMQDLKKDAFDWNENWCNIGCFYTVIDLKK